mmetsp:Transcript_8121/g.9789  ORF Transcript_8121/g.9789 Transcript_8121/m.9789 type:complete len:119 (-) Transcript_8121:203-559(-)
MHIGAFLENDPFDKVNLSPDEGGLAYLGRIKVKLQSQNIGVVLADHYMKWAFHFLVDVESGFPLRLYGPFGVRQEFANWRTLGEQDEGSSLQPNWHIPVDCIRASAACEILDTLHVEG